MQNIELSVHQLVDFVLRKGDLDTRSFNVQTMQEGTKIHNIYQSKQGNNYLKEYSLSGVFTFEDYLIFLTGRADGIILSDLPTVEEIKSTNTNLEEFYKANSEWHLGQAVCYAYLYAKEKNLTKIGIKLTYISQINNDILNKNYVFNVDELYKKILSYFKVYFEFERILEVRIKKRNESLKKLIFPFENVRPGQNELIEFTQMTSKEVEYNFVEASTGIGKTMSTIFGALQKLSTNELDKIFYLCPKNTNFKNCQNALKILNDFGYKLSSVEIFAKSKMCPFHLEKGCNPLDCPFTKNYYTNLKSALVDVLTSEYILSYEKINEYAKKYGICPFEFSLDLSLYMDFVVCDYNYAFHPIAYLRRFFDAPDKAYKIFALIDEAHNLIDRARDMYTVSFSSKAYKNLKKEIKAYKTEKLNKEIRKINQDIKMFKEFDFSNGHIILETLDKGFISHLTKFRSEIGSIEAENPFMRLKSGKDFLVDLYKFLTIYELINDGFKIILSLKDDDLEIKIFCIDPSNFINTSLFKFLGALFFSATLTPIDYFQKVTLNKTDKKFLSLSSPFNPENFKLIINDNISIKYKDRDKTLLEVAGEINAFVSKKVGNYIIFVPSFEYLNKLKPLLKENVDFVYQKSSMNNDDKNNFLEKFKENPEKTLVGVCVISGSFSESIDLAGNRLIGVVIVGVGLPQVNFENNLIKDFYVSKGINGYQFAYTNPGINKVLQAIGRVIRTEDDKGIALIIDTRYKMSYYREILEKRYSNIAKITNTSDLEDVLNSFYKN